MATTPPGPTTYRVVYWKNIIEFAEDNRTSKIKRTFITGLRNRYLGVRIAAELEDQFANVIKAVVEEED